MSGDLQRLGKYEIVSRIGEGGMAIVYRARLRGPAQATREVALKVIHPHLSEQEDFVLMFLDEMRVAMALTHRNIVQTFDGGEEEGRHFLVMELVDGCSLSELVHRSAERIPLDLAIFIGMEVCAALDFAHTFRPVAEGQPPGVVHRDVSLSNILVSRHGDVKLADFGVAKAAGRLAVSSADLIKGKLDYMAPEQAFGKVEPRSDLFAMGAVLYRLIGGESIREGASLESVRIGKPIRRRLSTLTPEIPPAIDDLVMSCLESSPSDRPPSAAALREALAREALALQLDAGHAPDPYARLRAFVKDRLGAPVASSAPAPSSGAARVARALLAQARDEPDEATERERAGQARAPEADTAMKTIAEPRRGGRRGLAGPGGAMILAAALLALGGLAAWLASRDPEPRSLSVPELQADSRAAGTAAADLPPSVDVHPPDRGSAPPDGSSPAVAASVDQRAPGRTKPARPRRVTVPTRAPTGPATLWVMTRAEGRMVWAQVTLDGRGLGESPLRVEVPSGVHVIEVRREGYRPVRRTVTLAAGQTRREFFSLEK